MKRFWSILLSLLMVLTLLPAFTITANAAYGGTGTFKKVSSVADLEAGAYYVLYGINNSYTGALTAAASATRPQATAVTITSDTITDPAAAIVWRLDGQTDAWTLYNESLSRYCEITEDSTKGFAMNATASTSYKVTLHATEGFRFITNHASGGSRGISLYQTDFRSYAESSMNTLHLYKLEVQTSGPSYTALNSAIATAQSLIATTVSSSDGAGVAIGTYWATSAAIDELDTAVTTAQDYLSSQDQTAIDSATATLQTAIATFNDAKTEGTAVPTLADVKAMTSGTATTRGWVTYKYGSDDTLNTTIISDYSGTNGTTNGLVIFDAMTAFSIGDYVQISGTVGAYGGIPQLTNVTATVETAPEGQTAPVVQTFATWAEATAVASDILGEYVCIQNVTLGTYTASSTVNHTDSADGTIPMYRGASYTGTWSENTAAVAGSTVNLHGVFSAYNGSNQLRVGTPKNYEAIAGTYTVRFLNGYDGGVISTQSVSAGDSATAPADPTRTGYTFDGWDASYANVQANLDVSATWTINSYDVFITAATNGTLLVENASGDEIGDGDSAEYNSSLTITATPEAGYILTSLTANGVELDNTNGVATYTMGAADVTFAATFATPSTFAVTLSNCGTTTSQNVTEGNSITLPTYTTAGDYTFAGWMVYDATFTDDQTTAPTLLNGSYTPTAAVTLVAIYVKTLSSGGAASLTKMAAGDTLAAGDKVVIVANGTTFGMYKKTTTATYVDNFTFDNLAASIEADVLKYFDVAAGAAAGTWKFGDSTNGYLYSSGSNNMAIDTSYSTDFSLTDVGDGTFKLVGNGRYVSCRTDLTSSNANLWRLGGTTATGTGTKNLDLYKYVAGGGSSNQYTANPSGAVTTYEVTYTAPTNGTLVVEDANGDEVVSGTEVESGTVLTITATANANYNLATLTVNGDAFTSGETYTVTGATEIAATFELIQVYEITITAVENGTLTVEDANGDAIGDGDTVLGGAVITVTATPADGYRLLSLTVAGESFTSGETYTVNADTAIAATFEAIPQYTVSYIDKGAAYGTSQTVYDGTAITLPADLTGVGDYTFAGWMVQDESFTDDQTIAPTLLNGSYTPTATVTLVAIYVKTVGGSGSSNAYTLVEDASTLAAGDTLLIVNGANAAGAPYATGNTYLLSVAVPAADANNVITLVGDEGADTFTLGGATGSWSLTSVGQSAALGWSSSNSITYAASGDNALWTIGIDSGVASVVNKGDTTRKLQYNSSSPRFACYTTAQADIQLYKQGGGATNYYSAAPSETITHTVTFTNGYGGTIETQQVDDGDGATAPADPTREGYTFTGWDAEFDAITADLTVNATWTANTYAVTIDCGENGTLLVEDANGDAVTNGDMVPFGTVLTITATPADNTFKVASLTVGGTALVGSTYTMGAAAVTIAATFEAKAVYTITFMDKGESYDEFQIYEGEAVTFETLSDAVGDYAFAGWIIDTTGFDVDNTTAPTIYTEEDLDYIPTTDVTFTSVYTKTEGGSGNPYVFEQTSTLEAGTYVIMFPSYVNGTTYPVIAGGAPSGGVISAIDATSYLTGAAGSYVVTLTADQAAYIYTLTVNADGTVTLQTSAGNYIMSSGSGNTVIGGSATDYWTVTNNGDGTYRLAGSNTDNRILTCRDTFDFRAYKSSTVSSSGYHPDLYLMKAQGTAGTTYYTVAPTAPCTHNYTSEVTTAATCTTAGVTTYTCTLCGDTYTEAIDALGHDYDDGVVTTAATCVATGVKTFTCSRCDDTYTNTIAIDPANHANIVDVAAVAATCTDTGLTAGRTCTACNTIIVAQEQTNALGHDIVTDAAVAATCTETGLTEGSHCTRCEDATVAQTVVAA
ncbi:MAG: InlB B-repeat-containing protein, partial [Eubacteriales bacterium]|nr:InlB B-repeat-containing protein [Eubacteriales bacterium]